jgi:hypothetical protein
MKDIILIVAPLTMLVASGAAAQSATPSHEQHQAAGQHPVGKAEERCCCDEKMREMMMNMMQMHQGHQNGGRGQEHSHKEPVAKAREHKQ